MANPDNLIDIVKNYRERIRILEEENQRLRAENDPEALTIVHAMGVASANDAVRELKAENERLKEALELATFCTCENPDGSYPHSPTNPCCNRDQIVKLIANDKAR